MTDDIKNKPSQPAGAREWLHKQSPKEMAPMNGPQYACLIELLDAYAREQTAAKDTEIADLRRQRDLEWDSRKAASSGRIAAQRERDSLREALKKIKAKSENSLGLRVMVEINELTDAALKAGKEMKMDYDIEAISAAVHEAWMENKCKAGVSSRKLESGEELMVPYGQLSETAKELDRGSVRAVVAAIEQVNRHDR